MKKPWRPTGEELQAALTKLIELHDQSILAWREAQRTRPPPYKIQSDRAKLASPVTPRGVQAPLIASQARDGE